MLLLQDITTLPNNFVINSSDRLRYQAAIYKMDHCGFLTALILHTCYTIVLRPPNGIESSAQAIVKSVDYQFRDAIKEDIDDITIVVLDAFSPSLFFGNKPYRNTRDIKMISGTAREKVLRSSGTISTRTQYS
jgi:hypothetical protein